jgi:hypothetical protein
MKLAKKRSSRLLQAERVYASVYYVLQSCGVLTIAKLLENISCYFGSISKVNPYFSRVCLSESISYKARGHIERTINFVVIFILGLLIRFKFAWLKGLNDLNSNLKVFKIF